MLRAVLVPLIIACRLLICVTRCRLVRYIAETFQKLRSDRHFCGELYPLTSSARTEHPSPGWFCVAEQLEGGALTWTKLKPHACRGRMKQIEVRAMHAYC
jgi:hypothetical protein